MLPNLILCTNFPSPIQFLRINCQLFSNFFLPTLPLPNCAPDWFVERRWLTFCWPALGEQMRLWTGRPYFHLRKTKICSDQIKRFVLDRQAIFPFEKDKDLFGSAIFPFEKDKDLFELYQEIGFDSKPYFYEGDLFLNSAIGFFCKTAGMSKMRVFRLFAPSPPHPAPPIARFMET